jgi:hypothetical protein
MTWGGDRQCQVRVSVRAAAAPRASAMAMIAAGVTRSAAAPTARKVAPWPTMTYRCQPWIPPSRLVEAPVGIARKLE